MKPNRRRSQASSNEKNGQSEPAIRSQVTWTQKGWRALFLLVLLSLIFRIYGLNVPAEFYFDEVYHGYTATRYLHGDKNTYNPWAKNEPGRAYEWTHPPLAKLMMTGTMALVGENSFGWRLGSVLMGTGVIALTAQLALELFASESIALLAAFFLSFECLSFAQARIAMNDSYFIFFMLLTLLSYVRWKKDSTQIKPLLLAGVGLGLAFATKWAALYLGMILCLDLVRDLVWKGRLPPRKSWVVIPIAFGFIPAAIYVGSYLHMFLLDGTFGSSWNDFIALQQQMLGYHSHLKATHPYQSVPWQWILNLRPVWMYTTTAPPGKVMNIYNLGNSVILFIGFYAAIRTLILEKGNWAWERWFLLLSYFMLWLPWSFSPRIMFFYHYTPAIPFLCILLARWIEPYLRSSASPRNRQVATGLLIASVGWFVLFYPNLTATPVPETFANWVYFLVPSWR